MTAAVAPRPAAVPVAPLGICFIPDRKSQIKPPKKSRIAVYPHGIEIESSFKYSGQVRADRSPRGAVEGFSAASRRRMLWTARTMDLSGFKAFVFVTLTYHDNWQDRDYKKDRENYLKRIRRLYPDAAFLWRLEAQKRGAPHFHLLFLLPDAAVSVCAQLEDHWHELVDKGNVHHKKHGAEVIWLETGYQGVTMYLSKYSAKVDRNKKQVELKGRAWGKSQNLPTAPTGEIEVTEQEEVQVRRFVRALMRSRQNRSERYAKTVVQGHTSKVWLDNGPEPVLRYIAALQKENLHTPIISLSNQEKNHDRIY